jgi:hypothetical protein
MVQIIRKNGGRHVTQENIGSSLLFQLFQN